jgi:hypothetical protein
LQEGFGWTNGVFLSLADRFPDLEAGVTREEVSVLLDIFRFLNAVSRQFYSR